MSKKIKFQRENFDYTFEISDDGKVKILDKGAAVELIWDNKIFIIGNGKCRKPRFNNNGEEQDIRFINRNICCFDMDGNFLWQIEKGIFADLVVPGASEFPFSPYNCIYVKHNKLFADNRDGRIYEVNPENGRVKVYKFLGKAL